MVAVPSTSLAMQVAQLPASHEKGGDIPIWRAVCRIVVPGRCSVVSVRPSSSIVTCDGPGAPRRPRLGGSGTGSAGVNRSMWIRAGVDAVGRAASLSTRSMNGPGPQT